MIFFDLFDPWQDVVSRVTYRGRPLTAQCQKSMTWYYLTTQCTLSVSLSLSYTHTRPPTCRALAVASLLLSGKK